MIRLLRFLKPYRMFVAFVLVLAFLQSLANLYLPTLMADIVDTGIVKGDTGYIMRVGGFMLLIAIGGTICAIAGSFFSSQNCYRLRQNHTWKDLHACGKLFSARV